MNEINKFCIHFHSNWLEKAHKEECVRLVKELHDNERKLFLKVLENPNTATKPELEQINSRIKEVRAIAVSTNYKADTRRESGVIKKICRMFSNLFDRTRSSALIDKILKASDSNGLVQKKMRDSEIIKNLEKQGFNKPKSATSNTYLNRATLFESILCHIGHGDLSSAGKMMGKTYPTQQWDKDSLEEKIDVLKSYVNAFGLIQFGAFFMRGTLLNFQEKEALEQLYIDIQLQSGCNIDKVRQLQYETSYDEKYIYCRNNYFNYFSAAKDSATWAGITELLLLGKLFDRKVEVHGQNHAVSLTVPVDPMGDVFPSYTLQANNNLPPIYVFLKNGGECYQELTLK